MFIGIILGIVINIGGCSESNPADQLSKITDMQKKLRSQIETISKTQSQYQETINDYSNEIKKEKEAKHITSYAQASERVKYNIQLIQEVDAYQTELVKIKQVTENGLEEAIYAERRLNAKFLMAKTIGDGKVLSQEVDGLLKKYGPLMDQYVIDPKKLTIKSPEEIWEQIGGEKRQETKQQLPKRSLSDLDGKERINHEEVITVFLK
jgi:hypothetical protein